MNITAQPPLFVPTVYRREIELLSKAALMDLAWDLASVATGDCEGNLAEVMATLRKHAEIIVSYRKRAMVRP